MKDTYTTLAYQHDEHRVHLIVYHLIWYPRRRKPVLVSPIAARCQQLIEEKCAEKGWQFLCLAVQPDHVHLFVRVYPAVSAAMVIKEVKGMTARYLREEFHSTLSKLPSMWMGSYFASTAGNVSQHPIQKYLEAQKGV